MREDALLLSKVELERQIVDITVSGSVVSEIAPHDLSRHRRHRGSIIHGDGGWILPGLHDHHIHLLALAARRESVDLNHLDRAGVAAALRAAARASNRTWIRATGHHEEHAGHLDRHQLDEIVSDRPVRVQHASGAMWVLNSAALELLPTSLPDGSEYDEDGRPNGRLHRADRWLRAHVDVDAPNLQPIGTFLASRGVTGLTDMTPHSSADEVAPLIEACVNGALPQRLMVAQALGHHDWRPDAALELGPVKVILDERELPPFDDVVDAVGSAREAGRTVAFHCVGRAALAFVLAVVEEARGDNPVRVEHASVVPPEMVERLVALRCQVVTQPGLAHANGDRYLTAVDSSDRDHLWPCERLLAAGVPTAGSSDAPYGPADPWSAMAAAVTRATVGGHTLPGEQPVTPDQAVALYLAPRHDIAAGPRRIRVGSPADLCLLTTTSEIVLGSLSAAVVRATVVDGVTVHAG